MTWRRGAAVAAAGVALAALAAAAWTMQQTASQRARGAALFGGASALPARLVGHDRDLPAVATRCTNCHEGGTAAAYASPLTAAALTTPRARRGGPPSAFDAKSLCALLRKGTDPAHVMISTTMPRYEITDAQCDQLWLYLVSR